MKRFISVNSDELTPERLEDVILVTSTYVIMRLSLNLKYLIISALKILN